MTRHCTARRHAPPLLAAAAVTVLALPSGPPTAGAQSLDDVAIASGVVLDDRYPDRRSVFPNGVTGLADVVYSSLPGYRPLTLDLYLPPASDRGGPHPLLVVIHGGGWLSGHTRHSGAFADWPAALAAIASDGYVVASVEYRLSGEAPFPAAFDDVRNAIRWLRAHAADYGIDRDLAVAMGGSAGGQLAGLVGTACGDSAYPDAPSESPPAESACVQGVVSWYGVFDFAPVVAADAGDSSTAAARYLACGQAGCDRDTVRDASAISFVDAADPPFLLIHGVDDPVVSIDQSRAMHARLTAAGVRSRLIEIPGVRHSFIGATPEATLDASRRAFAASVAFLRERRAERRQAGGR